MNLKWFYSKIGACNFEDCKLNKDQEELKNGQDVTLISVNCSTTHETSELVE